MREIAKKSCLHKDAGFLKFVSLFYFKTANLPEMPKDCSMLTM